MATYAKSTEVSSSKSRDEIERTLKRYGADQFMYGWDEDKAVVGFRMENRYVRFELPMPDRDEFTQTPTGKQRVASQVEKAYEQAVRQKWRALALVIKAKLEAVESDISTFEREFLANIVMSDGKTVAHHVLPKIDEDYESGNLPPLLPMTTN